jgi:Fe-S cluster assembly protein SufD
MSKLLKLTAGTHRFTAPGETEIELSGEGDYVLELAAAGVELKVRGIYDLHGKGRSEVSVVLHHLSPHTKATTVLKGVVRDTAFLRLVGRIIIEKDCGDSHSFLTERVLLLSDTAKAETVPDLEIKTDDVSCSHAASLSRIPEEHIFYLMSRGLTRTAAEEAVVKGFLGGE